MPAVKRKNINLNGFSGITKSSPGDNATGGVTLYINKSVLFSEIELDTDLQAVAVRVSAKKTLTVCNIYPPPSLGVNLSDLENSRKYRGLTMFVNKLLKNVRKLNGKFFETLLQKMYLLLSN